MTDTIPPHVAASLAQLGIVLLVRKLEPVSRDAREWMPIFKGEEPPF